MPAYRTTEQHVLIDLLATLTADYTKLLTCNGEPQQLETLHKDITAIQKELRLREKLNKYTEASPDLMKTSFNPTITLTLVQHLSSCFDGIKKNNRTGIFKTCCERSIKRSI